MMKKLAVVLSILLSSVITLAAVAEHGKNVSPPKPPPGWRVSQPVVTPPVFVPPSSSAPTVTSICATRGTTAGGTAVVLTGTGFSTATAVNFGSTSASGLWWASNDNTLTVSSPAASAGAVNVRVTNPSGQSATGAGNQFTYVTPGSIPTVTSITPNNYPTGVTGNGDALFINGTKFTGTTNVQIGGASASFGVYTDYALIAAFPNSSSAGTGPQHVTVTNGSGTSTATCADVLTYSSPPTPAALPATATRPSYNTGNGFFVKGRGIYDANGNLFIPAGANLLGNAALQDERFFIGMNIERNEPFFRPTDTFNSSAQKLLEDDDVTNHVVPLAGIFFTDYTNGASATTGQNSLTVLQGAYHFFVCNNTTAGPPPCTNNATNWTTYNNIMWYNPANEWGPGTSDSCACYLTNFVPGWTAAISAMRSAGYTAPIVIDAGGSGQDATTIVDAAVALEAADPLHNIIFDVHMYNNWIFTPGSAGPVGGCGAPNCNQYDFQQTMAQFAQMTVPVFVEEFGCANCLAGAGVSPVTPDNIMTTTFSYQMGYVAWGLDDNAGYGGPSCTGTCLALLHLDTSSFQWCYKNAAGTIVAPSYGQDVVGFATYGIMAAGGPNRASVFSGSPPTPPACPF